MIFGSYSSTEQFSLHSYQLPPYFGIPLIFILSFLLLAYLDFLNFPKKFWIFSPCWTYVKEVTEFWFRELWYLLKSLRSVSFFIIIFFPFMWGWFLLVPSPYGRMLAINFLFILTTLVRTQYIHGSVIIISMQVALLNGITMGGGAGVSIPGMFRVATDKTVCSNFACTFILFFSYLFFLFFWETFLFLSSCWYWWLFRIFFLTDFLLWKKFFNYFAPSKLD